MELATATRIARQLVSMLEDSCERIEIAGSIRRQKPKVKDIELVCLPKLLTVQEGQTGLFDASVGQMTLNVLDEKLQGWRNRGLFKDRLDSRGRPAWGPSLKRALYWEVPVDIFSVLPPAQWGLIYMIRTGSGVGPEGSTLNGFGPAMLARWKKVSGGGFSKDGCLRLADGRKMLTAEEEDVFRLCKVTWVPPEERTSGAAVGRYALSPVL